MDERESDTLDDTGSVAAAVLRKLNELRHAGWFGPPESADWFDGFAAEHAAELTKYEATTIVHADGRRRQCAIDLRRDAWVWLEYSDLPPRLRGYDGTPDPVRCTQHVAHRAFLAYPENWHGPFEGYTEFQPAIGPPGIDTFITTLYVEDTEAFRRRFDETRDPAPTGP